MDSERDDQEIPQIEAFAPEEKDISKQNHSQPMKENNQVKSEKIRYDHADAIYD